MFDDLNQCLGWSLESQPEKGLLLISNEETDGGFLLHHFLSVYVKRKLPICLVTLSQTFSHYAQACMKIGANLDRVKKNLLCHINIMEDLVSEYLELEQSTKRENLFSSDLGIENTYNLYLSVNAKVDELLCQNHQLKNSLLIFDDLSVLFGLGLSYQNIQHFLHYLNVMAKSKGILFVALMPSFIGDDYDKLLTFLMHSAKIIIKVNALPTGYSKDVHGHMQILRKKDVTDSIWQYKLSDKNLHIFAKGTSSAVL